MKIKILMLIGSAALWAGCSTVDNGAGGVGEPYYGSSGNGSSSSLAVDSAEPSAKTLNSPAGRGSGALNTGTGGGGIAAGTGIGSGSTGTGH